MKNIGKLAAGAALIAGAFGAGQAVAGTFDSGLPVGWACAGNCGTLGANGVVSLAPGGGSQYGWVSTSGGASGNTLAAVGGTNGSTLNSSTFSASAGTLLDFNFNYVTSDGAGYADYGYARLMDSSNNEIALLFTARTAPSGSIVPGFGMPTNAATLTPTSAPIIGGGPAWSPLGGSSGGCYSGGCGYTGWIQSTYTIATAGSYYLQFGVANWGDTSYDTGMAFDGITVGGTAIEQVPEPASLALLGLGFAGLGFARRRKQQAA